MIEEQEFKALFDRYIQFHKHKGIDSPQIDYNDLLNKSSTNFTPATAALFFDDFIGGNNSAVIGSNGLGEQNWSSIGVDAGGGQVLGSAGEASHPGIVYITGNAANANHGAAILNTYSQPISFGAKNWTMIWGVKLINSSSGQRITLGISDDGSNKAGGTKGFYFELDTSINANWRGVARTASANTYTSSGGTPTTNWVILKMVMNTAGTSIEFFVDGISIGTITTGFPSSANNGQIFAQAYSFNATECAFYLDYHYFIQTLTR